MGGVHCRAGSSQGQESHSKKHLKANQTKVWKFSICPRSSILTLQLSHYSLSQGLYMSCTLQGEAFILH